MKKTLLVIACILLFTGCATNQPTTQAAPVVDASTGTVAKTAPVVDTANTPEAGVSKLPPALPPDIDEQSQTPEPSDYQPRYIKVVPRHKQQVTCKPASKTKPVHRAKAVSTKKTRAKSPIPDLKAKPKLNSTKPAKLESKKPGKTKKVLKYKHNSKK